MVSGEEARTRTWAVSFTDPRPARGPAPDHSRSVPQSRRSRVDFRAEIVTRRLATTLTPRCLVADESRKRRRWHIGRLVRANASQAFRSENHQGHPRQGRKLSAILPTVRWRISPRASVVPPPRRGPDAGREPIPTWFFVLVVGLDHVRSDVHSASTKRGGVRSRDRACTRASAPLGAGSSSALPTFLRLGSLRS